jgi:hypothetical protein
VKRWSFLLCGLLAASGIAAALAASPPRIISTSSYENYSTSVRISAKYENHRQSTHAVLQLSEHGTMADLRVAKESTEPGFSTPTHVHFYVTGLMPQHSYWYRILLTTAYGKATSEIGHFRTTATSTAKPSISFDGVRDYDHDRVTVSITCNGNGLPFTTKVSWSHFPDMRAPTVFSSQSSKNLVGAVQFHPMFNYAKIGEHVEIYFQAEVTSANGTVRTGTHPYFVMHGNHRH